MKNIFLNNLGLSYLQSSILILFSVLFLSSCDNNLDDQENSFILKSNDLGQEYYDFLDRNYSSYFVDNAEIVTDKDYDYKIYGVYNDSNKSSLLGYFVKNQSNMRDFNFMEYNESLNIIIHDVINVHQTLYDLSENVEYDESGVNTQQTVFGDPDRIFFGTVKTNCSQETHANGCITTYCDTKTYAFWIRVNIQSHIPQGTQCP